MISEQNDSAGLSLRLGLLIDSFVQPQWIHKIVADIQSSAIADVELVIKYDDLAANQKNSKPKKWNQRKYWLYNAYSGLDDHIVEANPDALKVVNIKALISACPVTEVIPIRTEQYDYFQKKDVATIREYRLDVVLYFGKRVLQGDVLQAAKFGIWSHLHGNHPLTRNGLYGFWEVMEERPVTACGLQILTEDFNSRKIICHSYIPTHKRSVKGNRNKCFWKSTAFIQRKLEHLYQYGPNMLDDELYVTDHEPDNQSLADSPTNKVLLPHLLKFGARMTIDKLQKLLSMEQWFLAYQFRPEAAVLVNEFHDLTPMIPPKDRFWADPFPVKHGNQYFIFLEEYMYEAKQAHIAVLKIDQAGRYSQSVTVLKKDHHLSYPFIFQWQGDYFMIPETAGNRTIELYRCLSFPFDWQFETVLMEDVRAVDTTLAEIEGLWWMFVYIRPDGMARTDDELHLFYADTPLGPWHPHRHNPVKSDCRSARPAGNLFRYKENLYRPAQDCSRLYGYAISINKITQINPDSYLETEVSKVLPHWSKNLFATHTLNKAGDLIVTDGMLRRSKLNLVAGLNGLRIR